MLAGSLFHCAMSARARTRIWFRASRRQRTLPRARCDVQRHTHQRVTHRVPRWCASLRRCWQSRPTSADRIARSSALRRAWAQSYAMHATGLVPAATWPRRGRSGAQAWVSGSLRSLPGAGGVSASRQQRRSQAAEFVAEFRAPACRQRSPALAPNRCKPWHVACISSIEIGTTYAPFESKLSKHRQCSEPCASNAVASICPALPPSPRPLCGWRVGTLPREFPQDQ